MLIGTETHKEWSAQVKSLAKLPKAELVRRVRALGFIDTQLSPVDRWSKDELIHELAPMPKAD